jgi:hypothetical protein
MHFSTWLWEQMEEPSRIGYVATICWKDVNNGCAHAKFGAPNWIEHIKERHPEQKDILVPLIVKAFQAYMLSLATK